MNSLSLLREYHVNMDISNCGKLSFANQYRHITLALKVSFQSLFEYEN